VGSTEQLPMLLLFPAEHVPAGAQGEKERLGFAVRSCGVVPLEREER
jgi:hypothetical protein